MAQTIIVLRTDHLDGLVGPDAKLRRVASDILLGPERTDAVALFVAAANDLLVRDNVDDAALHGMKRNDVLCAADQRVKLPHDRLCKAQQHAVMLKHRRKRVCRQNADRYAVRCDPHIPAPAPRFQDHRLHRFRLYAPRDELLPCKVFFPQV